MTEAVGKHLHLHVAWSWEEALEEQRSIAEGAFCKATGSRQRTGELRGCRHDLHTLAAATGGRFDDQRQGQLACCLLQLLQLLRGAIVTREHRHTRGPHPSLGDNLRSHRLDGRRGWSDKNQPRVRAGRSKCSVLGEKSVARMNCACPGRARRVQNPLNVEIAIASGRAADANRRVGFPHVTCPGIRFGVNSDGADPEPARGPKDAAGNLAAVGNQQTIDHSSPIHMRRIPSRVGSAAALCAAARHRPRIRRVSAGSITPSSQSRADAK